jgi:hypothetical protein
MQVTFPHYLLAAHEGALSTNLCPKYNSLIEKWQDCLTSKLIYTWMEGRLIQPNGIQCLPITPFTTLWLGMLALAMAKLLLVLVLSFLFFSLTNIFIPQVSCFLFLS